MSISPDFPNLLIIMLIPILGIMIGMLAVYFEHKEKMKLIEKGLIPEESKLKIASEGKDWQILAIGLLITAVGSGRVITAYLQDEIAGLTILFLGLAIIFYFVVKRKYSKKVVKKE